MTIGPQTLMMCEGKLFERTVVDSNEKNSPDLGNTNLPLAMTRQQVEVFELLRDLSTEREKFHEWYQGAVQALGSKSSDRIAYKIHVPLIALTNLAPKAPQDVTSILRKLKLPDNSRVGDQIIQCISKIRDTDCIQQLRSLIAEKQLNHYLTSPQRPSTCNFTGSCKR